MVLKTKRVAEDYYVVKTSRYKNSVHTNDVFLVKNSHQESRGTVYLGSTLLTDSELIGKRVRLKMEVLL